MKNSPGQIVPDNHPPVWGWHKAVPTQEDFERLWMLQVMVWKLVIQVNWLPSPTARGDRPTALPPLQALLHPLGLVKILQLKPQDARK